MTRSFLSVLLVTIAVMALSPMFLQGCSQTGVGDPCTPEQEYDPTFLGFAAGEVNVESKSFDCQTRLCLANHFQGRVSCPYGQAKGGVPPALNNGFPYLDKNQNPIAACELPGSGPALSDGGLPPNSAVSNTTDMVDDSKVPAQCVDRTGGGNSPSAVYCSCRCENESGKTNDGAVYCACPSGFTCTQLVTSIGPGDNGLTGGYCIKNGTQYDSISSCGVLCNAAEHNCGSYNGL